MRASLLALALSATVALAFDHHVLPARGLHAQRMEQLVRRQDNGTTPAVSSSPAAASVPLATTSPAAVDSVAPTTASSSSDSANILGSIVSPVSASSSDTAASVSSTPGSSAALVTSASSGLSTTPSAVTKSAASGKASAVTSTSTQVASGSASASDSSASSSGTAASDSTSKKSSSGVGHTTLIIIIVIASCIAGIAAIWTIIRKTKFSPSRRFEAKLAPIEFGGRGGAGDRDSLDGPDAYGAGLAHARSQSAMSSHSGANAGSFATSGQYPSSNLVRSDSGGNGSLRGAPMAEVSHLPGSIPYSQSSYTGAQPYYAGQSPYGAGAAGYPAEPYNANGQYADLQRGASTASSARPYNGAPTGGYNYAAHNQAASQQRY